MSIILYLIGAGFLPTPSHSAHFVPQVPTHRLLQSALRSLLSHSTQLTSPLLTDLVSDLKPVTLDPIP